MTACCALAPSARAAKAQKPVAHASAKAPASPKVVKPQKASQAQSAQERRIESAKASLVKLRADARRRRYRDGWEAIARELDIASKLAGPQQAEAALLAARVREEQWGVSRAKGDAETAVDSYIDVSDRFDDAAEARPALVSAVKLAVRTGLKKATREAAYKLRKLPRSPEADAALALAKVERVPEKAPLKAKPDLALRAAQDKDRKAQLPVEADEEDESSRPAGAAKAAVPEKAGKDVEERGEPQSPLREPASDVPPEAAKILEAIVAATKIEVEPSKPEPAKADNDQAPADKVDAAPSKTELAVKAGAVHDDAEADGEDNEGPPEGEEGELVPIPGPTRASAPKGDELAEADPDLLRRARSLRSLLLGEGQGSVAAQLGLQIHKIVIDAGHGGKDTGAIGKNGVREKDVALSIAKKVAERLRALGFEVVLTRDRDVFLSLDERTRLANEAGADLFLSVHCNSARKRTLSGVETWTLNVAADRYAKRLAAFENADAGRHVSDLKMILADLFTKVNAGDARELASAVQSAMVRTIRSRVGPVKDNGVKHALFYVLLGAKMPAVLVETAFLSNPTEEKRLKAAKYQDSAAEAIARGVKDFVDARRKLAMAE
ncbi:MAG: N-acetylmuramoyl-L-alanine amidase [Deltaproteobacteria bacterium]|nr:N-acetylmuramoyl-L-alanine amidase [Deltaproteobacteria bacterium]